MSMPTPVIHVVDDDASFLKAVSRLLRQWFCGQDLGSAGELLSELADDVRGCVIADLQMPGLNGLELQAAGQGRQSYSRGFSHRHWRYPQFGSRDASRGRRFSQQAGAPEGIARCREPRPRTGCRPTCRARPAAQIARAFESLTPRDREVLALVLRGRLNKQIAIALGIDERSVKRHGDHIMTKLQVESVAELTHLVHAAGLYGPNFA